jgi:hypothetical protein
MMEQQDGRMARTSVSESLHIAATPSRIWEAVSDLPGMGRFSLENTGGRWLSSHDGASVGARFRGTNRHGPASWSTTATVTRCEELRRLEFRVTYFGIPISTWSYEIAPDDDGATLTESWTDQRPAWFAFISSPIRADRSGFTRTSIRHTLDSIAGWATEK